jgi:hypothetical protein
VSDTVKLRRLRAKVREAVYWLGCVGGSDDGGDYCDGEECIRCNLRRALRTPRRRRR